MYLYARWQVEVRLVPRQRDPPPAPALARPGSGRARYAGPKVRASEKRGGTRGMALCVCVCARARVREMVICGMPAPAVREREARDPDWAVRVSVRVRVCACVRARACCVRGAADGALYTRHA